MKLHFQINSSTGCLSFIRGVFFASGLSRAAARSCAYAMVEAVNNAIFHAHKCIEDKIIDIRIFVGEKRVTMEVGDSGDGFDLDAVKKPSIDQIAGRGIFIIRSLVERVEYKDNILRMIYER
ncbi:MAG: ATP-binding protein [Deltaproteobacteria bacterium]|nr:ATP-binding protein [Deltaproteobacteria bacterium]MBI2974232.1 ATP-binding protein [Deltaproteobacteria bacterium]